MTTNPVEAKIKQLGGWRGATLGKLRDIITTSEPGIAEAMKWQKPTNPAGVPTWSKDGIICTGESYKEKLKLTFAHGARLDDPKGLFNASLDGATRRAIDFHDGDEIDETALAALVRAAAKFNLGKAKP